MCPRSLQTAQHVRYHLVIFYLLSTTVLLGMGQHTFILPVFRAEPALSPPLQRGSEVLILVAVIPYDAKLVYEDFSCLCLHCQHWNAPKLEVNLIFLYHFMKVRAVIHFFLKYWELFRWRVKREEVSPPFPLFAWQQKRDSHRLKACLFFALCTAGDGNSPWWGHLRSEMVPPHSRGSGSRIPIFPKFFCLWSLNFLDPLSHHCKT